MAVALLLCALFINAFADPPSDWQTDINMANLLYSSEEPSDSTLMASVGNGNLATVVLSDTLYVAGLFNGYLSTDPSHRARIPSPVAIDVVGDGWGVYAAGLDLLRGAYYRRLQSDSYPDVMIEETYYAHQTLPRVFVTQIDVIVPGTTSLQLNLGCNYGAPSPDIMFFNSTFPSPMVNVTFGYTNVAETNTTAVTEICMVSSVLNSSVSISSSTSLVYYTSIATSLDSEDVYLDAYQDFLTASSQDADDLFATHEQAWADIWTNGGFEVQDNLVLAQAINSSIYYILSSIRQDRVYSLSPGSLSSNGYNGHTFWDCEFWMYPGVLLLQPELAQSLLQYRVDRFEGAEEKAESYNSGYTGTMFPWESALTGEEVCPTWAGTGLREQHISGDIAFAARQYWWMTGDVNWLKQAGWGLASGIAEFWTSRVELDSASGEYVINDIIPPDEYADHVNNSVFTNVVAQMSLNFAMEVATVLNVEYPQQWEKVATNIKIPFNEALQMHPEYDGYANSTIKQADVILLGFPLDYAMSPAVRQNDLDFYAKVTDPDGPAMTWGMAAIGYLEVGDLTNAAINFERSYANIKAPFNIWTETPTGGTTNFITGAGGFLQGVMFGYPGLRITADQLNFNPAMFSGVTQYTFRNLHYCGASLNIVVTSSQVSLQMVTGILYLTVNGGTGQLGTQPTIIPLGPFSITDTIG